MESVRQQKVSRLLQKEIGLLFQQSLSHLTAGNILTVTVVRIAPDLGFAKVYLSVFPEKEPKQMIAGLNENIGEITRTPLSENPEPVPVRCPKFVFIMTIHWTTLIESIKFYLDN